MAPVGFSCSALLLAVLAAGLVPAAGGLRASTTTFKDTVKAVPTSDAAVQDNARYCVKQLQAKLPDMSAEQFGLEAVLSALSQPSAAEVVKTTVKNFLGMRVPMQRLAREMGTLYYLTILTTHASSSPLTRQLNPFPMLELTCAKVWVRGKERSLVKLATPKRKLGVLTHSAVVRAAADVAIKWLGGKLATGVTLRAVVGAESQELLVQHLHGLNTVHGKVDWGVESEVRVYYVTLLAQADGASAPATHMFALARAGSGPSDAAGAAPGVFTGAMDMKVVAHVGGDAAGISVVSGEVLLNVRRCEGEGEARGEACTRRQVAALRKGLARVGAMAGVVAPETVQVSQWARAPPEYVRTAEA
eukprot:g7830.t1